MLWRCRSSCDYPSEGCRWGQIKTYSAVMIKNNCSICLVLSNFVDNNKARPHPSACLAGVTPSSSSAGGDREPPEGGKEVSAAMWVEKRQDELQHLENLKLESVKPVEHKIIPALPPQQCTMASVRCKLFCLNIFYFWSWCQTSQPLWFIPGMDTMETQPLLDSGLCASTLLLDSVAYILYMLAYTRIAYI